MSGQEDEEKEILVIRSSFPSYEEYIETTRLIWGSVWLTSMGDFHRQLEKELKEYMGIRNTVPFVNGYMALEMATQALELTGEMITTPFSFVFTTHTIVHNNLTPVFYDINPEDYTMDPEKIEALITDKTSAIMPVHVCGNPCDVERIEAIVRKHGLKVIYDVAYIFGGRYKGKSVAEFRDVSIFSFHVTKVFNSIEGGAVTSEEDRMERRLNYPKNFGIMDRGHVVRVDRNAGMNEFQAIMGLCNLHYLDRGIGKRKKMVEHYLSDLAGVLGIKLPPFEEGLMPSYTYFPMLFEGLKTDRDQVHDCLAGHRVCLRKYFCSLISDPQYYEGRFSSKDTPMVVYIMDHVLTLPCYVDLELEGVGRTCGIIRGVQETNMGKILLVIPAFSEEKNMEGVVKDLVRDFPCLNYVVVDDDSRDSTAKVCRDKGYNLLDLPVNLGLAEYFQADTKYTYRKGYRYIIQFDGDGQHRPEYVEAMRQKMEEGYDIVTGSRFVTEKKGWSARTIGSRVIGSTTRPTTGTKVTDPTSGMRVLNRKMIGEFALNLNYGSKPGVVSFLIKRGAKVVELQVTIDERLKGENCLKPLTAIHYMARMLIPILMIQNFRKRQYQGTSENCFSGIPGAWRASWKT